MTFLLDVNVLISLADPLHVHHAAATAWFQNAGKTDWATCPITENGFLRIITHPRYGNPAPSMVVALAQLILMREQGSHRLWSNDVSLTETDLFHADRMTSGETTDIYLLGLAKAKGGHLATFDRRIKTMLVAGGEEALHVIPH